jgi:deoxyhypusine synthase
MMEIKDLRPGGAEAFLTTGFQATNIGRAIALLERMRAEKATIFLSFTANMAATGLRGLFAQMCRKKLVDVIITTGGSLDHDLIRTGEGYGIGDFSMDDAALHRKGINRLGNVLIKNSCYEFLEKEIRPVFERLYNDEVITSPSAVAREIGNRINDKGSFLYWCSKNGIPVFSPGITDSAIGLQTYFFKQRHPDFGIDTTKDMKALADIVLNADKAGGIVLGGGISKHHTIGVNLLRGGLDYAIYVTTSSPWDGSLSGARTNEAVSWGKIAEKARRVTVDCDATIAFPLIIRRFLR